MLKALEEIEFTEFVGPIKASLDGNWMLSFIVDLESLLILVFIFFIMFFFFFFLAAKLVIFTEYDSI